MARGGQNQQLSPPRATHPVFAGNHRFTGRGFGVRQEVWKGRCVGTVHLWFLYTWGQFSSTGLLLWSWGFRIAFPNFHGPLKLTAEVSHGCSIILPSGRSQGPLLDSSNLFLRFPKWKSATVQRKSSGLGGIHQEETWAPPNIAMQMHVYRKPCIRVAELLQQDEIFQVL